MANSYISVTYNGSNNVITLPFSYLDKTHLHLYKNATERPYSEMSFNSAGTIVTVTTSLTVGDIITIIRQTPISIPWVNYSTDLGSLSTTSLNESNKHNLYAVQEARDYTNSTVAGTLAEVQAIKDEMDTALTNAYAVLVDYAEDCSTALTGAQAAQAAAEAAQAAAELAAASIVLPTSAQILAGLLTVDGSGSGLDADLLDGHEASYFATDANLTAHTGATAVHSATSANTASRIVTRDASGNFSAGTITAALTGNASTATTLANSRTFTVTGDVTATAQSFNGSANVSMPTTLVASAVLSKLLTVDGAGSNLDADLLDGMQADTANVANTIAARDASGVIAANLQGTATSATSALTLLNSRTFTITGDVTAPAQSFNGSTNVSMPTTLAAATILTKLLTVDGSGTGLDADVLDGMQPASTNTASTVVSRDASGNFSAGTITAALSGNASTATSAGTATTLANSRTFTITGDVTAPAQSFNGTTNVSMPTTLAAATVLSKLLTVDGTGSGLDADVLDGMQPTSANTASTIVSRDASGNFTAGTISANLTGTATSSTYALQMLNSRTFNLSGAVTGTAQSYDGTANIVIPTTITSPVNANITRTTNITLTANTATCTLQTDGVLAMTGSSCQLKGDNSATNKGAGALRVSSATSGTTGAAAAMSSPTRATDTLNLNCSWSAFTDGNYLCFYMGDTEVARIKQGKVVS